MTKTIEKKLREELEKEFGTPLLDRRDKPTGEFCIIAEFDEIWQFIDSAIKEATEAERERTKEIILRIGDAERHGWVIDLLSELSQQKGNDER